MSWARNAFFSCCNHVVVFVVLHFWSFLLHLVSCVFVFVNYRVSHWFTCLILKITTTLCLLLKRCHVAFGTPAPAMLVTKHAAVWTAVGNIAGDVYQYVYNDCLYLLLSHIISTELLRKGDLYALSHCFVFWC